MSDIIQTSAGVPMTRSATFAELYANGINIRVSATDLGLVFTRATTQENGKLANMELTAITMSPQTFKMLTLTVLNVLNEYEAALGEIKIVAKPNVEQVHNALTQLVANASKVQ